MAGCLHFVGCCLLGACIPVHVVCSLFVGCRSGSSASAPTQEAAFVCRTRGWLLACCWSHVLIACMLFVACRSSSSACVLTWEAALAVRAASVLVDGVTGFVVVCDYLRLFFVSQSSLFVRVAVRV